MYGDLNHSDPHLTTLRVEGMALCFFELEQTIKYFLANAIFLPHVHTG